MSWYPLWKKGATLGLSAVLGLSASVAGVGSVAAAAPLPPVVVVMMENREDTQLTSSNAPYLTSLKTTGRYFSMYTSVVHPSFPNYLAIASGSTQGNTGGGAVAGAFAGPNLWSQLSQAGVSWGVYQEYMPSPCYARSSFTVTTPTKDQYAINHNPATVFADVFNSAQCQQVLPLSQMTASLPAVSFVTPSYCDDMHGFQNDPSYPSNCQVSNTNALITRGDAWLQAHVEQWRAWGAIVIVTFDEGKTNLGGGGRVLTLEVGAGVEPSVVATPLNHYSVLAGIEDRFGLPRINNASGATPLPIGSGTVPPPDTTPPSIPGKPAGTSVSSSSIDLTWGASTDAVSSTLTYRIYRDANPTPIGQVASNSTGVVTFTDVSLAAGSTHTYQVDAADAVGNSSEQSAPSEPIIVLSGTSPIFADTFSTGTLVGVDEQHAANDRQLSGRSRSAERPAQHNGTERVGLQGPASAAAGGLHERERERRGAWDRARSAPAPVPRKRPSHQGLRLLGGQTRDPLGLRRRPEGLHRVDAFGLAQPGAMWGGGTGEDVGPISGWSKGDQRLRDRYRRIGNLTRSDRRHGSEDCHRELG